MIVKGLVRVDDIDFSVCHMDMLTEISTLRGIMRKKFPQKREGAFSDDIVGVIKRFLTSILYDVIQDVQHPNYGMCKSIVGTINEEAVEQVEKFKYLGTIFTSDGTESDGKLEEEMERRIGVASAVLRELARPIVTKAELILKSKLSMFKSIFIPILIYGHESWRITEKIRTRVQAAEMGFLSRVGGLTRLDMVRNTNIRESLGVKPMLFGIEKSQLRLFGHVLRMPRERKANLLFLAKPKAGVGTAKISVVQIYGRSPFIIRPLLMVMPIKEHFLIDIGDYVPQNEPKVIQKNEEMSGA
ncbi:unnamed protein product [Soboliphyme baturini]|uniref:DNA-directed RNA polymerase n=1 Tax=Soboliphyme baturini TaxID=241478 RepID=A0A183IWS0_9BILA|nr:unnamed protein product [Soboliphyme baturini]